MEIRSVSLDQIQQQQLRRQQAVPKAQGESFANTLQDAMRPVAETEAAARSEQNDLLTGEGSSIHSVVMAAEKADLALQLTVQIRDKVLDAYNEVMRMQI